VKPFEGISGTVGWEARTLVVPAGDHTVRWTYTKDASIGVGLDAGFVDQVSVA
jgi:hypothetical protein